MKANDFQISGEHYRNHGGSQHWDRAWEQSGPGYFVHTATAYVERHLDKNGVEDLLKARHYIDKLIELERAAAAGTGPQPGRTPPMLGETRFGADPGRVQPHPLPADAFPDDPPPGRCGCTHARTGREGVCNDCGGRVEVGGRSTAPAPPCDHDYDRFRSLKDGREYLWCVRCGGRKEVARCDAVGGLRCCLRTGHDGDHWYDSTRAGDAPPLEHAPADRYPYAGQCAVETCPVD